MASSLHDESPRRRPICAPHVVYDPKRDFTRRIYFASSEVNLFGWPSRGGVIVLERAESPDFNFLGLDRIYPPEKRHENPDGEDEFCKKLLLLGAKWWDSISRYSLLKGADEGEADCIVALEEGPEPEPSLRERYWVCVAWPSSGGLVVSEFQTTVGPLGVNDDNFVPEDVARLRLCRNMDERAAMLKERFHGETFANVKEYQGNAFIGSWSWKEDGEHGAFQQTWQES